MGTRLGNLTLQQALEELDKLLLVHDEVSRRYSKKYSRKKDQSPRQQKVRKFCGGGRSVLW